MSKAHEYSISSIVVSNDGKYVISSGPDMNIIIHSTADDSFITKFDFGGHANILVVSHDSSVLLAGSSN